MYVKKFDKSFLLAKLLGLISFPFSKIFLIGFSIDQLFVASEIRLKHNKIIRNSFFTIQDYRIFKNDSMMQKSQVQRVSHLGKALLIIFLNL